MRTFYPPIEPHARGMLEVGDGNSLCWEECGTPDGKPVVFLHGGPGSGCSPDHRRLFDPDRYRIVLFDQRNCGRSIPSASIHATDLSANTTWNLVADIELLREHLGIDRWQVFVAPVPLENRVHGQYIESYARLLADTDLLVTLDAEDSFDLASRLGEIQPPTLVTAGARDRLYTPQLFADTCAAMLRAQLELYPRRGHRGTLGNRPLARRILRFLASATE